MHLLDGRLDEPEWRDAPVLRLVQQSPNPGLTTSYETEVRIIVSDDRIFFGFQCKDPHPDRLSIHTMRRDETMGQDGQTLTDDTVSIVLDTSEIVHWIFLSDQRCRHTYGRSEFESRKRLP